ncbi:hypothetical protein [Neoroseomonas soli]|uniref:Uncharacterized protein n=1 Tax=Neoroseomonas soli TaxID=1081025 RepID=A0A9X9WUQ4_9PROT|nr:hypothetical protein [Neoroseomonas soli]MBR0670883.1 hypothetical protein [Neoroseomonas soli]
MIKKYALASAVVASAFSFVPSAQAQREAMGMFYQMQMAPRVCGWQNAPSTAKLDAAITAQEQGLRVTAADREAMRRAAEVALRADPTNCAADGMLRMMFDEAVK